MCGFWAMIGTRWREDFAEAVACLSRRGPDEQGLWEQGEAHLGHRRLSIIDLVGGKQPMTTHDGRHHIVFNGEIYNFGQLRDELAGAGHRFQTHSDTEVLLNGYAMWGVKVLGKLDGMFAFAVWDAVEKTLFAARDRMGIKPLFYSTVDGLQVGSTLESWWRLRGFPRRLDEEALFEYLAQQVIPAPMSILKDVRALEPGCWMKWEQASGKLRIERYWEIPGPTDRPMSVEELIESADAAISESVKRQMVADVPLGAFLSGGVDSSLMVAYMSRASAKAVKTFTVRFPGDVAYDESGAAAAVARRFSCEHHVLDADEIDGEQLEAALAGLDQPFADPAYLPTRSLSKLTRGGVTVAISGDGGDELFGGYGRFLIDAGRYPPTALKRWAAAAIRYGLLPGALTRRTLWGDQRLLWDRVKLGPWKRTRKDMAAIVRPEVLRESPRVEVMGKWLKLAKSWADPITTDALMRADLWTYLSDDCLVKTDRGSMAYSLEVRVPLLGNPVVDLVLPQPAGVKLAGGLKTVLKELARRQLPREVWDRPKHGFSVPMERYFRGPWRKRCDAWAADCGSVAPFLNAEAVRTIWRRASRGHGEMRTTYTLMALLGWLEHHRLDG